MGRHSYRMSQVPPPDLFAGTPVAMVTATAKVLGDLEQIENRARGA
jgi:hypothetical protein